MTATLLPAIDYHLVSKNFLNELEEAAKGKPASLPYLKHVLPVKPLITKGIIQGIVIGGTNYVVSTKEILANGSKRTLARDTGVLPVFQTKDDLIAFFDRHLNLRAEAIGINFGFPLIPTIGPHGELDGKLITGTKEHLFVGALGNAIGKLVRETVKKDIPVSVANDTVCLTLAGDGDEQGSLIAGTGFNIGIKQHSDGKNIVINLECGNFDKFEISEALKIIDEHSETPGKQLFEKIISGKYLAEVFNIKAKTLGINHTPITTSQQLSALSHQDKEHDANILARALLERSASLVASALAAVYLFNGKPPKMTIIGEGSLLWLGWEYLNNIHKQIVLLGVPNGAITIKHIQDSSLKGAIGLLTQGTLHR